MSNHAGGPGRDHPDGCVFEVLVSAGSSRSRVQALHGEALKVAVRAAPEKGKANREVLDVLATFLQRPVQSLSLVTGQTSRIKRVLAKGLTVDVFRSKIRSAGL